MIISFDILRGRRRHRPGHRRPERRAGSPTGPLPGPAPVANTTARDRPVDPSGPADRRGRTPRRRCRRQRRTYRGSNRRRSRTRCDSHLENGPRSRRGLRHCRGGSGNTCFEGHRRYLAALQDHPTLKPTSNLATQESTSSPSRRALTEHPASTNIACIRYPMLRFDRAQRQRVAEMMKLKATRRDKSAPGLDLAPGAGFEHTGVKTL
jgi:hypothetical protein